MAHRNLWRNTPFPILAGCFLLVLLVMCSSLTAQESAIKIRLFHSMAPGINETHALGFTKPMVDLLSRKVGYSTDFNFEDKQTLMEFGQDVSDGDISLGVVWGLEFGWLSQKYPKLKLLSVTSQGGKGEFPLQMIIPRTSDVRTFCDLKGRRLATYERASLMIQLFRDKAIRDHGFEPKGFFHEVKSYPNPKDAIFAVKKGEADILVMDVISWVRFTETHPQGKVLVPFLKSEPVPEGVIFGRPDVVNSFRPGLWSDLQKELVTIHDTPEGKQCAEFWGLDSFDMPEKHNIHQLIERCLHDYPFIAEE